jgi:stage II sporulation protein D
MRVLRVSGRTPIPIAVLALAAGCGTRGEPDTIPELGPRIRVQVLEAAGQVLLSAKGAVRISTLPDLILRYEGALPDRAAVTTEGEGFRLAGQFYPSPIRIASKTLAPIALRPAGAPPGAGRAYRGALDLVNADGRVRTINDVSLEEYVAGVVGGEMPSDFPPAALEAQAVAARTYALYHLMAAGKRPLDKGFDASASFQVYSGWSGESPAVRRAVRATAGWILTCRGKVFPTYFHSTCGGNTPNGAWILGDEEIPPLRGVRCDACAWSASGYRWKLTVPLARIEEPLRAWAAENGIRMGALKDFSGIEPLPGGYLRYIRVVHDGGSFQMRADVFKRVVTRAGIPLKSTSFEAAPGAEPETVELTGKGWGHGVGMCQYGAGWKGRSMTFAEVLASYYPDSEMKKVY